MVTAEWSLKFSCNCISDFVGNSSQLASVAVGDDRYDFIGSCFGFDHHSSFQKQQETGAE